MNPSDDTLSIIKKFNKDRPTDYDRVFTQVLGEVRAHGLGGATVKITEAFTQGPWSTQFFAASWNLAKAVAGFGLACVNWFSTLAANFLYTYMQRQNDNPKTHHVADKDGKTPIMMVIENEGMSHKRRQRLELEVPAPPEGVAPPAAPAPAVPVPKAASPKASPKAGAPVVSPAHALHKKKSKGSEEESPEEGSPESAETPESGESSKKKSSKPKPSAAAA